MALTFNQNYTNALGDGFLTTLSSSYLRIYKGVIPAGPLADFNTTNYTADLLVQLLGSTGSTFGLVRDIDGSLIYSTTTPPVPTTATGTGTATWAALGNTNYFLIGEVTATGGNGLFHIDNINVVSGNPVTPTGFRIKFI